ncbi:hypothetical protein EV714DRAFT_268686 [Schizophyllum commune]
MSADHAHDVEHSAPTHDLELKWTRATSENHTKRRDGPPQLPSLLLGLLSRCDRYSRDAPADGDVMDGYPLAYASRHPESPPKKRERAADADDIMPDLAPPKRYMKTHHHSPSFNVCLFSEDRLRGVHDSLISPSRKFDALDTRYLYKRRITSRYTSFTTLKSFLDVNYSGLRNILKKYLSPVCSCSM